MDGCGVDAGGVRVLEKVKSRGGGVYSGDDDDDDDDDSDDAVAVAVAAIEAIAAAAAADLSLVVARAIFHLAFLAPRATKKTSLSLLPLLFPRVPVNSLYTVSANSGH